MCAFTKCITTAICVALFAFNEALAADVKSFTGRIAGSAEVVNGTLYVLGGASLRQSLPDVGAYNPVTGIWTRKVSIPTPRVSAASAVIGSDIYIVGGRNGNNVLSSVERYSTSENKWVAKAPMPTARWSLTASVVDGKLYVFGGIAGTGNNRRVLDVVEVYDPESNSWESLGKMPEARQGIDSTVVDGRVYIISGKIASYVEPPADNPITRRVDAFDPQSREWKQMANLPTGRVGATTVVTNNLIYVVGGIAVGGDFPREIAVFNPKVNQWSAGPSLATGRSGHMCGLIGNSIYVLGGSSTRYGSGQPTISNTMEIIPITK